MKYSPADISNSNNASHQFWIANNFYRLKIDWWSVILVDNRCFILFKKTYFYLIAPSEFDLLIEQINGVEGYFVADGIR